TIYHPGAGQEVRDPSRPDHQLEGPVPQDRGRGVRPPRQGCQDRGPGKGATAVKDHRAAQGGERLFKEGLVMSKYREERRRLVKRTVKLCVVRQCELLEIHRRGVYYKTAGESPLNLALMRLIDENNLLHPWLGVPQIRTW